MKRTEILNLTKEIFATIEQIKNGCDVASEQESTLSANERELLKEDLQEVLKMLQQTLAITPDDCR